MLTFFLASVTLVLILSNYLYYLSTRSILIHNAEEQNQEVAEEMNSQIVSSEVGTNFVEHLLGNELRMASLVGKYALNPDAAKVTNQQLVSLASEIGVNDITLFQPKNGDIVGVKSSDPKEIGLSTKSWSGWFPAFQKLLKLQKPAPGFGESEPNFWTGPFANATSNPKLVRKWGYFYDGSTNYIIDPFVQDSYIGEFTAANGPSAIAKHIMNSDSAILDITAFNPNTFGKKPIVWHADGNNWVDLKNFPVIFGSYTYKDAGDVRAVDEAYDTKSAVSYQTAVGGRSILKVFIPLEGQSGPYPNYVVGFVTDYNTVIGSVLARELQHSLLISIFLLAIVTLISVFVSKQLVRPLASIREQVERLAGGQFEAVAVRRNDEFGDLAKRVNVMSRNFSEYTNRLLEEVRNERAFGMQYLGVVASGLIHELRNPVSALKTFIELFPSVQALDGKGEEVIHHMKSASDHVNSIVNEFSDFIRKGKMNLGEHSLVGVIEEALALVEGTAKAANVQLSWHRTSQSDIVAMVDRDKIRQVIINLLSNAIDAIGAESDVRNVQVNLHLSNQGDAEIDVVDSGRGIPASEWETIFTPFHSSKKTGFGLGLSLCKFIVLSNGGTLEVAKSGESGTVMRITLPLALEVPDLRTPLTIQGESLPHSL